MEKKLFEEFINNGLSTYKIAKNLNKSQTSVRYWLKKFDLKTNTTFINETHRKCGKCDEIKDNIHFYNRGGYRGEKYSSYCKDCHRKISLKNSRNLKLEAIEYKGGKCEKCGYNNCVAALEFHHLDPKQKDFELNKKSSQHLTDLIKKELDKCILICANCHREIHYNQDRINNTL